MDVTLLLASSKSTVMREGRLTRKRVRRRKNRKETPRTALSHLHCKKRNHNHHQSLQISINIRCERISNTEPLREVDKIDHVTVVMIITVIWYAVLLT